MKTTLLATVAVAALALGGSLANAQERGAEKASPAQATGAEMGAHEKAPPRAAQAEPNHGAAQSGHATGQQRAAEQRGAAQPNHETGQARAQDRRPNEMKSGAADTDASKHQAQQEHKSSSQQRSDEHADRSHSDRSKDQARDDQAHKGRSTAAGERDRKADHAQATDAKEPAKAGGTASKEQAKANAAAAEKAAQKNAASAADAHGDKHGNRVGAAEHGDRSSASAQTRGDREDVNVTGSIQVDRQKATRVHDELIRKAPRTDVKISVNVGTELPRHVHMRPVPASIISISPEFRGYDYVVVRDEIVIVEPKTRKVVTIIESGGHRHRTHKASLTLDAHQKSRIRSDIKLDTARDFDVDVREGRAVPQTVVLQPLPDVIYSDIPAVEPYRYFVDGRRIIIVDPDTREVVDIID